MYMTHVMSKKIASVYDGKILQYEFGNFPTHEEIHLTLEINWISFSSSN